MIAETGHFALILAFLCALVGGILPLAGASRNDSRLLSLAVPASLAQFLFTSLAFAMLTTGYLVSDFSILNVVQNSHTLKPVLYKISGVWGNHEGSLLLWVLILTLFASAVAMFGRSLPERFRARVLAVQSLISAGFFAFLLFTSNPFQRISPAPLEGHGLNPLLQDPGLAFHPPFLYLGYVGFSIAFAFAVAALLEGEVTSLWARWVRPWTLAAWSFLTGGIALGSWWAYYELGWGGWWFWDPVENASFLPWLAGTALLHSTIVVEKREALRSWTILLAILTFSLSLLGTFLVRSGVLISVHAFASDPARGIFILVFLGLVIGGSLTLYALRASKLKKGAMFAPISREGALLFNNLFLVTALGTVLIGTLYPLFLDAVTGDKISVGPPYFETTFVTLMTPVILAMALGPLLPWKQADLAGVLDRLKIAALVSLGIAIVVYFWFDGTSILTALGLFLGFWLALGVLVELAGRLGVGRMSLKRVVKRGIGLPRSAWGMSAAHLGLAVLIIGVTTSGSWTDEALVILKDGESRQVGPYIYTFEGARPIAGPNYTAIEGHFEVERDGRWVATLRPEQRTFSSPRMQTTEAAIKTVAAGDLYSVIGEAMEGGGWTMRLYFKPLIAWIWLGALMMVFGGFLSLSDRRGRARARKTGPAAAMPQAAE